MPVVSYRGKSPKIRQEAMVTPLATVIGDVEISKGAAVFAGAVIRGDVVKVMIGKYSTFRIMLFFTW